MYRYSQKKTLFLFELKWDFNTNAYFLNTSLNRLNQKADSFFLSLSVFILSATGFLQWEQWRIYIYFLKMTSEKCLFIEELNLIENQWIDGFDVFFFCTNVSNNTYFLEFIKIILHNDSLYISNSITILPMTPFVKFYTLRSFVIHFILLFCFKIVRYRYIFRNHYSSNPTYSS